MGTAATAAIASQTEKSSTPLFTTEQKQRIIEATTELICATVEARVPVFADPTLGGAAEQHVAGAFVSLKRCRHLRGCCGGLQEQPVALGKAVYDATLRTVTDDVRFPAVSHIELDYLDLEVWLLYRPQRIQARGEDRLHSVETGGKHGLVIERGPHRGLLLPGVALDHGWDPSRFLEQTCVKAGIHASLWKDDATAVFTFEGAAIAGKVSDHRKPAGMRSAGWLRQDQLAAFGSFCRANISAMLVGATPNYYAAGLPDGTVNGVVLTLRRPSDHQAMHFSHLSLRPGVPFQATLFSLAQTVAQYLTAQKTSAAAFADLELTVSAFLDPAMHGTVADPHLDGIETKQRAQLVIERARSSVVYDRTATASDLLSECARQARVVTPPTAAVYSLEAVSTEPRIVIANVPRPDFGAAVRCAAVAGKFYPADAEELDLLIKGMIMGKRRTKAWPAAMIPHAGLRFSGNIAAGVLQRIRFPPTVIIIGPKHTPHGAEWAVAPNQTWSIPGHTLESDRDLVKKLVEAIPGLTLDALAHRDEHAIEVELPLLARLAPKSKVVGIVIGHGDLDACRTFADGLARVMRECDPRPLLLISSDMNHFAPDEENRRLDEMALAELDKVDPESLYQTVTQNQISMCGVLPAVIVLETLKRLAKPKQAERVGYATSADVTGDKSRVVGYAGMLFG